MGTLIPFGILLPVEQTKRKEIWERTLSAGQDTDSSNYHWSHILVPGELKSNPDLDIVSGTWPDLGREIRERGDRRSR